jgi:hypothetical protein
MNNNIAHKADKGIMNNSINLVQYIVCYAKDRGITLTTLRLVKFLYLADLYFARAKNGITYTGFPWAFVHFGPYCREAMSIIDSAVKAGFIISRTIESKYSNKDDFNIYDCTESLTDEIRDSVPDDIKRSLNLAIKKLGEDTPALLDYVYFATEPMENVKPGERLNFTKALPIEPNRFQAQKVCLSFSKDELTQVKKHVQRLRDKFSKARENLVDEMSQATQWKDEIYYETLERIDEEMKPVLSGTALISN